MARLRSAINSVLQTSNKTLLNLPTSVITYQCCQTIQRPTQITKCWAAKDAKEGSRDTVKGTILDFVWMG
jgi:hypothetical protein